jgi:hypothetical protein
MLEVPNLFSRNWVEGLDSRRNAGSEAQRPERVLRCVGGEDRARSRTTIEKLRIEFAPPA